MEIEYRNEDYKNENIYKVGNIFRNEDDLYLVATVDTNGGYALVDLSNNQVFATFKTLEDLFINTGDEYDKLINVEINEI